MSSNPLRLVLVLAVSSSVLFTPVFAVAGRSLGAYRSMAKSSPGTVKPHSAAGAHETPAELLALKVLFGTRRSTSSLGKGTKPAETNRAALLTKQAKLAERLKYLKNDHFEYWMNVSAVPAVLGTLPMMVAIIDRFPALGPAYGIVGALSGLAIWFAGSAASGLANAHLVKRAEASAAAVERELAATP